MNARYAGLDFGTSNSSVGSVDDDGRAFLVEDESGSSSVPSAVFYAREDGRARGDRVLPADVLGTAGVHVGGSSSVPVLEKIVRTRLPDAPIARGDTFGSVGLGLVLDARRSFG